jgi:hypothetical protein
MNTVIDPEITVTYYSMPSILYVVEADQTRLIDGERGLSWSLRGVEAVLWDLLASGHPYQQIVHFISLWPNLPGTGSEKVVLTTLESWVNQGILEKTFNDQFDA